MPASVHYVCQIYDWKKRGGKPQPELEVIEMIEAKSKTDATIRAEKMHDSGQYAGVDAYRVEVDEEAGEYGQPEFFTRLGEVPETDD